ncbi:MAG: DUF1178 family protein [Deltaproteobacteria bacterium]|jgi:hypothetical protein|nr:DUF1178 family protein [Deltaproteobacteria bacterium]
MVIFDLICANGHQFEGWFNSLSDLEAQVSSKILTCPICGTDNILRRPSTFGLVKSRPQAQPPAVSGGPPQESDDEQTLLFKALQQLKAITQTLEKEFVDVGGNFTNEALKMHFGVSPKRNIRGVSTNEEEKVLEKEGVEFFKVPMLSRKTNISS